MINFKDISVVVQGRIDPVWTPQCLASIRRWLPEATVILSTQSPADTSNLDGLYDTLLLNEDDVFVFQNESFDNQGRAIPLKKQNLNRQIQSTRHGLKSVQTPYALKLRTDMVIDGTGFLAAHAQYREHSTHARCVKDRIVVGCHTTRWAKSKTWFRQYRCPFNISDFMCFGRTSDLINLWDIPYISAAEAFYFKDNDDVFYKNWGYRIKTHMRLLPEQYIWINFINKFMLVSMRYFFDNTETNVRLYEKFIAENLIVLSQDKLQISLPQRAQRYVHRYFDFTFEDWLFLYKKYCTETLDIPLLIKTRIKRAAYLGLSLPQILLIALLNLQIFARAKDWCRRIS